MAGGMSGQRPRRGARQTGRSFHAGLLQLVLDRRVEVLGLQTWKLHAVDEEGRRAGYVDLRAESDVSLDQLDDGRKTLLEVRHVPNLARALSRRRARHGRLVLEEPFLHLVCPVAFAGQAHGDGGLTRSQMLPL